MQPIENKQDFKSRPKRHLEIPLKSIDCENTDSIPSGSLQPIENKGDSKSVPQTLLKNSFNNNELRWPIFERQKQTQAYLEALSRSEGIPISELVISKNWQLDFSFYSN